MYLKKIRPKFQGNKKTGRFLEISKKGLIQYWFNSSCTEKNMKMPYFIYFEALEN